MHQFYGCGGRKRRLHVAAKRFTGKEGEGGTYSLSGLHLSGLSVFVQPPHVVAHHAIEREALFEDQGLDLRLYLVSKTVEGGWKAHGAHPEWDILEVSSMEAFSRDLILSTLLA